MTSSRISIPRGIVVMPALKRPEMAALALERIRQAKNYLTDARKARFGPAAATSLDVHIYVDHTDNQRLDEFEWVRDNFYPEAHIFHAGEHVEAPSGCWNILNALKGGYESGTDFIFLVEEDVMVYPGYFEWNCNRQGNYFATSGRRIKQHSADYYTNPGACFRRDKLGLVVPHINSDFFADRRGYLDYVFGAMDDASDLDDGLIRRVIRQHQGWVLYPFSPNVAHQGFCFYGRNPQYRAEGETIAERIESLRLLLDRLSPLDRYTQDFEPYRPIVQP